MLETFAVPGTVVTPSLSLMPSIINSISDDCSANITLPETSPVKLNIAVASVAPPLINVGASPPTVMLHSLNIKPFAMLLVDNEISEYLSYLFPLNLLVLDAQVYEPVLKPLEVCGISCNTGISPSFV